MDTLRSAAQSALAFIANVPSDDQLDARLINGETGREIYGKLQRALASSDTCTPASFLGYVEARRLSATDPKDAEFWQRLAGSVRKALTM